MILASASPRRQELLQQIGIKFQVIPSHCEEIMDSKMKPDELVMKNALLKARDVARQSLALDVVLGADTVVAVDQKIFGKPVDAAQAKYMLSMLAGNCHDVYTGLALVYNGKAYCDFAKTTVKFLPMSEAEIADYVATGEPLDKAGAYGIQGQAALYVEDIQGCYFNIVGLPLFLLKKMADKAGIKLK